MCMSEFLACLSVFSILKEYGQIQIMHSMQWQFIFIERSLAPLDDIIFLVKISFPAAVASVILLQQTM